MLKVKRMVLEQVCPEHGLECQHPQRLVAMEEIAGYIVTVQVVKTPLEAPWSWLLFETLTEGSE